MRTDFLSWYPENVRKAVFEYLGCQVAIEADAAVLVHYSPERGNSGWRTLCPINSEGKTVITAPKFLTDALVRRLAKENVAFESCMIGDVVQP